MPMKRNTIDTKQQDISVFLSFQNKKDTVINTSEKAKQNIYSSYYCVRKALAWCLFQCTTKTVWKCVYMTVKSGRQVQYLER